MTILIIITCIFVVMLQVYNIVRKVRIIKGDKATDINVGKIDNGYVLTIDKKYVVVLKPRGNNVYVGSAVSIENN